MGQEKREALLQTFLHVNPFNDFQRNALAAMLGGGTTQDRDELDRLVTLMKETIEALEEDDFAPARDHDADPVNLPPHYAVLPMEPTYFIVESGGFHWCVENFIKYISRYPFKNGIEDVRKALRNLEMFLAWSDGDPDWSR